MSALWAGLEAAFTREIARIRPADPAATQAAADEQLARVDADFDGLEALARRIISQGYSDGIFPDRRKEARA